MSAPDIFMATTIVMRMVEELLPYAMNSRKHTDASTEALCGLILKYGWTNPVLIADGGILAGHGRVRAAKKLGLARVPCIDLSHLNELDRRALVIADNRSSELSGWALDELKAETDFLRDAGMDLEADLGFSEESLASLFEGIVTEPTPDVDPDDAPSLPPEPASRLGDVWICGPHRVMCGSSLAIDDWDKLMMGELADVCWTDPPYNVAYEGGTEKKLKIQNDSMSDGNFRQFLLDAYAAMFSVLKAGAPIYVAHADTEGLNFRDTFREAGFKLSGCLIWRKNSLVLGRSDYQWMHEPILYGWKPGAAHRWYGGRKRTTVIEYGENGPVTKLEDGRWAITVNGTVLIVDGNATLEEQPGSIIYHERPSRNAEHPTMKPVGLIEKMLGASARRGDIVIDAFGGSGSTLVAADRMGMSSRMMELDPRYVDVIVHRWELLTGRRAVHAVTGEQFPQPGEQRAPAAVPPAPAVVDPDEKVMF